jgi:D-psicose/D-tagatose/L-ribulose 3-epimerase
MLKRPVGKSLMDSPVSNPIGIHLSLWQESWDEDLLPLIGRAARAGFEVAEFPLLQPAELDYATLLAELKSQGMRASCGTGLNPSLDVTHPDSSIREAGLQHLRSCLEGAARLESPVLGGVTYAAWGVFPEEDRATRFERCVQSMKQAAQIAEGHQVILCVEPLNRFEGDLINTVDQGRQLIEADDIAQEIRVAGDYLAHMHCVANNRKVPGQGHIPWSEVKMALRQISYAGYFVAECFVSPRGQVGHDLFIWRELAGDLDQAAAQIARFLLEEVQ